MGVFARNMVPLSPFLGAERRDQRKQKGDLRMLLLKLYQRAFLFDRILVIRQDRSRWHWLKANDQLRAIAAHHAIEILKCRAQERLLVRRKTAVPNSLVGKER